MEDKLLKQVIAIVPSRSRADKLEKYTYRWLKEVGIDYAIFVEPAQEENYKQFENVQVIPKNDQGVGYAFQQAAEYAKQNGYKYVFKLDDDISGFVYRKYRTKKDFDEETAHKVDTVRKTLIHALKLLEKNSRVGAVGFPYRNEMFTEDTKPKLNQRLQTSFVIKSALYDPQPEYKVREDFIAYVKLRQMGYDTLRIPNVGISCGIEVGGGTGGINDFDRKKLAHEEMEMIRKQFPSVVFKYSPNNAADWQVDFVKSNFERK